MSLDRIVAVWLLVLPITIVVVSSLSIATWSSIPIQVGFIVFGVWIITSCVAAVLVCSAWLWRGNGDAS